MESGSADCEQTCSQPPRSSLEQLCSLTRWPALELTLTAFDDIDDVGRFTSSFPSPSKISHSDADGNESTREGEGRKEKKKENKATASRQGRYIIQSRQQLIGRERTAGQGARTSSFKSTLTVCPTDKFKNYRLLHLYGISCAKPRAFIDDSADMDVYPWEIVLAHSLPACVCVCVGNEVERRRNERSAGAKGITGERNGPK